MLADFGDLDGLSLASSHGDQMFCTAFIFFVLLDFSWFSRRQKKKKIETSTDLNKIYSSFLVNATTGHETVLQ